ncbi:hypothetical protein Tco_1235252 [Tanacetum coccineum]
MTYSGTATKLIFALLHSSSTQLRISLYYVKKLPLGGGGLWRKKAIGGDHVWPPPSGSRYCSEAAEIGADLREEIDLEVMRSHGSSRDCSLVELSRAE